MPKDFRTGNCYCDVCGNLIGNLHKDGMGMRSRKYCTECAKQKKNEANRNWQRQNRRSVRELNSNARKAIKELSAYAKSLEEVVGIRQKRLDEIQKSAASDIVYAKCGRCGNPQDKNNKFCSECGAKFKR